MNDDLHMGRAGTTSWKINISRAIRGYSDLRFYLLTCLPDEELSRWLVWRRRSGCKDLRGREGPLLNSPLAWNVEILN